MWADGTARLTYLADVYMCDFEFGLRYCMCMCVRSCYVKTVELTERKHANSLKDYANLLRFDRKDFAKAEQYYRLALSGQITHCLRLALGFLRDVYVM